MSRGPQNSGGLSIPNMTKYMSLMYLRAEKEYDLNDYVTDTWRIEDYNLMRQLPIAEMTTDNPVDMAEELIELSMTKTKSTAPPSRVAKSEPHSVPSGLLPLGA